nr:hypothetical protein [Tanacetum cinerariifolium]
VWKLLGLSGEGSGSRGEVVELGWNGGGSGVKGLAGKLGT